MSVKLYARLDRADKHGNVTLFATAHIGGKQAQFALKESFPASQIVDGEPVPGKDVLLQEKAKRIRAKISFIEVEIEKARTAKVVDVVGHLKQLLEEAEGKPKTVVKAPTVDFFELYAKWVAESKNRISNHTGDVLSKNTIKTYNSALEQFKEYAKTHVLDICNIGKEFYGDFSAHCLNKSKLTPNTMGKYFGVLKVFMAWAEEYLEEKGIDISQKYRRFKTTKRYKGVDHLTSKELALFQAFETDKKHLRTACDLFLMMCYTGLSVGDLAKLKRDHIPEGGNMVLINRNKTRNECVVPFFDDQIFKPVALVEHYKGLSTLLPSMPDQKINEHIKTVAGFVGFGRFVVTTKIGRKTFATIKHLEQGVEAHIVMRATGHTTEKAFLRYVGTDRKAIVDKFTEKASFLKVG
jgi:site-specific recombinase XerD